MTEVSTDPLHLRAARGWLQCVHILLGPLLKAFFRDRDKISLWTDALLPAAWQLCCPRRSPAERWCGGLPGRQGPFLSGEHSQGEQRGTGDRAPGTCQDRPAPSTTGAWRTGAALAFPAAGWDGALAQQPCGIAAQADAQASGGLNRRLWRARLGAGRVQAPSGLGRSSGSRLQQGQLKNPSVSASRMLRVGPTRAPRTHSIRTELLCADLCFEWFVNNVLIILLALIRTKGEEIKYLGWLPGKLRRAEQLYRLQNSILRGVMETLSHLNLDWREPWGLVHRPASAHGG